MRGGTRGVAHLHGPLRQKPAKTVLGLDWNGTKLQSLDTANTVMHRERFVEVSKIGIDDIHDTLVGSDQFADEAHRLLVHVVADGWAELLLLTTPRTDVHGVEKPRKEITVDVHRFHLGDAQPLGGEILDKTHGTLAGQKPARLSLNDCGVIQLA